MELAWQIRNPNGDSPTCSSQNIASVALWVQPCPTDSAICPGDPPSAPAAIFPCDRYHGSTDFNVAPGAEKLFITVVCTNGNVPNVIVPEPIVRDVTEGDVTQLNALLISVPSVDPACGS